MNQSAETIKTWVNIISDDYMHYTQEQKDYVCNLASMFDFEILPGNRGVIGWTIMLDFDCKKKLVVVLLYCKPEFRGMSFIPMIKRLEEIAKENNAVEINIGKSIGVRDYANILGRFGYKPGGFSKEL